MKKIIKFVSIVIFCSVLSFAILYLLKHSNPYLLNIDENVMEYDNVDYENLYQITYGSITQFINEQTVTDSKEYIIKHKIVSEKESQFFFVGQYLKDEEIEDNESIRIISKEEIEGEVNFEYMVAKPITVDFEIDSQYINDITEKNELHISINDEEIPASIVKIGPNIKDNNKFTLKILINDTKAISRPGAKVDLKLVIAEKDSVLCLPSDCLYMDRLGQYYVMVNLGESIEIRDVEIGIHDDKMVEIIDGLSDGDVVIEKD